MERIFLKNFESMRHPEILLVDDTPEHIEFVVSILRENNYRLRIATKGSTALKLLKQHKPDLILLDVYMPEMNGFEVCKIIKNSSDFYDIPIIFLTASNDEESIKRGFEVGAQDYIAKPFNIHELLARVNTHIKLKQQADSLKEAYLELDSFCYSVSHDLKAPLFSIKKLTEYLVSNYINILDSEGQELITNIEEKSSEIITLIDRLLEFSKMCNMKMRSEVINLKQIFLDVYNELIKFQSEGKIKFTISELPYIYGDPIMIKVLVLNILSNAIKYTRNKELPIIEVSLSENENEYIISVKDNGVGFDMKYSSKLFGVFQRLHSVNEFEGSGVGLAITQRILKRHKGKAWITGEVEKGATFYFSLPKNNK